RRVAAARRVADCRVEHESAAISEILDLVSAAYRCFAPASKRNVPGEADGGTEIVQIAVIDALTRVRRVGSDIDDLSLVGAHTRLHPVVKATAGHPKQRVAATVQTSRQPIAFIWNSVIVPTQPEVEGQIAGRLPVVLEKETELVLGDIANLF